MNQMSVKGWSRGAQKKLLNMFDNSLSNNISKSYLKMLICIRRSTLDLYHNNNGSLPYIQCDVIISVQFDN